MSASERLARAFAFRSFMRPFIEGPSLWWRMETHHGEGSSAPVDAMALGDLAEILKDGGQVSLELGYGARMSAPGYMDCTEWAVFPTEDEAADYLIETYADEEDADEEDSDAQG